eukprot:2353007-Amphidinium_carterae.1
MHDLQTTKKQNVLLKLPPRGRKFSIGVPIPLHSVCFDGGIAEKRNPYRFHSRQIDSCKRAALLPNRDLRVKERDSQKLILGVQFAGAMGLRLVRNMRDRSLYVRLITSAMFVALGICAMHYMGMLSMTGSHQAIGQKTSHATFEMSLLQTINTR